MPSHLRLGPHEKTVMIPNVMPMSTLQVGEGSRNETGKDQKGEANDS